MESTAQKFVNGIDVSVFQGTINWALVAKDDVDFVIIRASYGITVDTSFQTNWSGARSVGIKRGAYHYFIPTDDVQAQADLFVKTVGTLQSGDLGTALDLEDPPAWASIAKADRLPLVLKWLQAVESALGIRPEIYCSLDFIEQVFDDATALGAYGLWIAFYATADSPSIPTVWKDWLFWQWSDKTTVSGITGAVDGDRYRGTLADLSKLGVPSVVNTVVPAISKAAKPNQKARKKTGAKISTRPKAKSAPKTGKSKSGKKSKT